MNGAFVPYPEIGGLGWPGALVRKREMRPEMTQESCSDEAYKPHASQQFVRAFVHPGTPYRSLLLFHGLGVGKTCAAVQAAEHYIGAGKALMIVPEQIQSGFRRSIYDTQKPRVEDGRLDVAGAARYQCTGTAYAHEEVNAAEPNLSRSELENRMRVRIGLRYKFMGDRAFSNHVQLLVDGVKTRFAGVAEASVQKEIDAVIREEFDDRAIVVDEAHELRPHDGVSKDSYNALALVLGKCANVRLLLLTATPMYHSAGEIVDLVNLMLINDKVPVLDKAAVFDKTRRGFETLRGGPGEALLAAAVRGRVSYVAGENPATHPTVVRAHAAEAGLQRWREPRLSHDGTPLSKSDLIDDEFLEYVVCTPMSALQADAYGFGANPGNQHALRQISNACFSVEDFEGKEEEIAKAYAVLDGDAGRQYRYRGVAYMSPANIDRYAPKVAKVVRSGLECVKRSDGVVFVYSNYKDFGVEQVAIALEEHGVTPYGEKPHLVAGRGGGGRGGAKAAPLRNARGEVRYITITKEDSMGFRLSTQKKVDLINDVNSNIRFVLGSEHSSQGLNLLRVREVHVLDPWWNISRIKQAVGRAVRRCSHASLPEEQRNVTVFYHCSVLPLHGAAQGRDGRESFEQYMYRRAFLQHAEIRRVEKLLAVNAVDCDLYKASHHKAPALSTVVAKQRTGKGKRVPSSVLLRERRRERRESAAKGRCAIAWPEASQRMDLSTAHPYQFAAMVDALAWDVRDVMVEKIVATYEEIEAALAAKPSRGGKGSSGQPPEPLVLSLTLDRLLDALQGQRWLAPHGRLVYRGLLYALVPAGMVSLPFTVGEAKLGRMFANTMFAIQ